MWFGLRLAADRVAALEVIPLPAVRPDLALGLLLVELPPALVPLLVRAVQLGIVVEPLERDRRPASRSAQTLLTSGIAWKSGSPSSNRTG